MAVLIPNSLTDSRRKPIMDDYILQAPRLQNRLQKREDSSTNMEFLHPSFMSTVPYFSILCSLSPALPACMPVPSARRSDQPTSRLSDYQTIRLPTPVMKVLHFSPIISVQFSVSTASPPAATESNLADRRQPIRSIITVFIYAVVQ